MTNPQNNPARYPSQSRRFLAALALLAILPLFGLTGCATGTVTSGEPLEHASLSGKVHGCDCFCEDPLTSSEMNEGPGEEVPVSVGNIVGRPRGKSMRRGNQTPWGNRPKRKSWLRPLCVLPKAIGLPAYRYAVHPRVKLAHFSNVGNVGVPA